MDVVFGRQITPRANPCSKTDSISFVYPSGLHFQQKFWCLVFLQILCTVPKLLPSSYNHILIGSTAMVPRHPLLLSHLPSPLKSHRNSEKFLLRVINTSKLGFEQHVKVTKSILHRSLKFSGTLGSPTTMDTKATPVASPRSRLSLLTPKTRIRRYYTGVSKSMEMRKMVEQVVSQNRKS